MKRIVILDTWTNNSNLGTKIIVEAVEQRLQEIFPQDFFYRVPALEYLQSGRSKIHQADYVFLAGTNLLSSNMEATSQWCIKPQERFWQNKVILMGLGWGQYQSQEINDYTRSLLNSVLHQQAAHSVRDDYTAQKLSSLGFNVINTGCPTLWWLTPDHCAGIPTQKADQVLLTFTEYNQNPHFDRILFEILSENYSRIYFWAQMYGDYEYAHKIGGSRLVFIEPSLEALDELLSSNQALDYVGNRLSAGIRSLQHQRRSIIVGIDNRAVEMGRNFNLPIIERPTLPTHLKALIHQSWATKIRLDWEGLKNWKQQFEKPASRKAGFISRKRLERTEESSHPQPSAQGMLNRDVLIQNALRELNANNNQEALKLWEQAITTSPDLPGLHYGKAVALARLDRQSDAIASLNHLLSVFPSHPKARQLVTELQPPHSALDLMKAAQMSLESNQIHAAFHELAKAKSFRQPTPGLDYLRAICFINLNQLEGAKEALNEELRYFPNNTEARTLRHRILSQLSSHNSAPIDDPEFQELLRIIRPYTMLSELRLYSLFSLTKTLCLQNIPGNIVECGVAGGGSTALMAAVMKRYSKQPRWLYACDSFEGMPTPTAEDKHNGIPAEATGWGTGTCAAPETSVREICTQLGVINGVKLIKGYFQDTLPKMQNPMGMIALLHIDGDWYESTQTILQNLYDRVVNEGVIQVDDYGYWDGCRQAVHEFETQRQIKLEIKPIDNTGVWFVKPDKFPVNPELEAQIIAEFAQDDPVAYGIESQMSANERFQLYYTLRHLVSKTSNPLRFIEIGSYAGASLFLTWKILKRMDRAMAGFAVEPGGQPQFYEVLKQVQPEVSHWRLFSHQAAGKFPQIWEKDGNQPGFIFVDGDHTYPGVKQDILNYFPLLAPEGIMMFHDYLPVLNDQNRDAIFFHHGNQEPGIRQACQELMENTYGCEILDIPLLYPTDPTQTQAHLPIIPGVYSTIRAYRKPAQ
ncbi:TylF/MycF/NovP-related O-methyltransferase [Laspinema palackyanum]|uniref:TylF/MycF/NovP-related O-methyltransferase n=1 Tax=Laspinema palackyanum TaxID=3231601 RepID=UPI00345D0DCE|nr:class I SAM-dependent methyltransferase [Laspinema sp. D2c]